MTLNTDLIDKESQKLYLAYIKDPRIPDDLCCEIYLEFIRRLKKYRQKEEKKGRKARISGGFIGQMIKRSREEAFRKNKRQKEKEEILAEIVERNASQIWCRGKSQEEKVFFDRIAQFLKDWSSRKSNHPQSLRIFLLYQAFKLSPDFIEEMAPYTDETPEALLNQWEEIKEEIREKANKQLEKEIRSMGNKFFKKVQSQTRCGNLCISQYSKEDAEHNERVNENREKVMSLIKNMKFLATGTQIMKLTGISERTVRYAYRKVLEEIQESFKDDTYWG